MIRNTQDTRFWVQSSKDGYYVCSNPGAACDGTTDISDFTEDASGSDVDWTHPTLDDDPKDPFCTAYTAA